VQHPLLQNLNGSTYSNACLYIIVPALLGPLPLHERPKLLVARDKSLPLGLYPRLVVDTTKTVTTKDSKRIQGIFANARKVSNLPSFAWIVQGQHFCFPGVPAVAMAWIVTTLISLLGRGWCGDPHLGHGDEASGPLLLQAKGLYRTFHVVYACNGKGCGSWVSAEKGPEDRSGDGTSRLVPQDSLDNQREQISADTLLDELTWGE
jgi:hypothetical protein